MRTVWMKPAPNHHTKCEFKFERFPFQWNLQYVLK